jgi:hypothetical protein
MNHHFQKNQIPELMFLEEVCHFNEHCYGCLLFYTCKELPFIFFFILLDIQKYIVGVCDISRRLRMA